MRAIALVMLVLWGLATSHCDLELLSGFEFLACCQHADTAPHQDNDCDLDGCSVVETGFYKVDEQTTDVPAPLLVLDDMLPTWDATPWVLPPNPLLLNSSPPELPRVWQFTTRSARSPRAPSFAS